MTKTTNKPRKRKEIEEDAPILTEEELPLVSTLPCGSCGQPVTRVLGTTPSCTLVLLCENCWNLQVMNMKIIIPNKQTGKVEYLG